MRNKIVIEKNDLLKNKSMKIYDKYKIIKQVGRGVSGIVYKAIDKSSLKTIRAIKRVQKKGGIKMQDLMNQLSILKKLDHPDVIRLYQWFEDQEYVYLVTEQQLEYLVIVKEDNFLIIWKKNAFYLRMKHILGVVKYCHSKKIAHRDLKPENFLLLKKSEGAEPINLKLIDFGLAIRWQNSLEKELLAIGKKKIVGTAYYISPQVINGVYDEKCDIWSIGIILYILVTGVPPFDGESDKQILSNVIKNTINFASTAIGIYLVPEMNNVSLLLKDLLKKILKPAPQRITIQNIYKHPWMTIKVNKAPILIDFRSIANFSKFSKIKALAATYLASQMAAIQTQSLQKMFKVLDQNGDGELSIEQLNQYLNKHKTSLSKIAIAQLKNLLQLTNSTNGKINYTQFLASTISQQVLSAKQNLIKVFNMMDKDGNGYLDKDEIIEILTKHGYLNKQKILQQVNQIFLTTDANSDGKIDFSQFTAVMCKIVQ